MADIKARKISDLSPKTDITPEAKLPIIDKTVGGSYDNFSMPVSTLTQLAKGDKGDTGPQGPVGTASTVPGPQGPAGPANSLSIGTVESGPTAQATITGSAPSQQLSLVLPKGDKGDQGEIGPPGPAGSGSGDMISAIYDPAGGARQVAFADQLGSGDHGALAGLSDDDHMQYALADGSRGNFAPVLHKHQVTDINASGRTISNFLRGDGTWQVPVNTTYAEITTAEIDAGTATTLRTITGRRVQYIKDWVTAAIATMKSALTKADVGLANVDNTSDTDKPVSTATQAAINAAVTSAIAQSKQQSYPVGSLYFNADVATNPATLLGFGTWVAHAEGRVPVGKASSGTFATAGSTGGAETHTLTLAQIPNVTGNITPHGSEGGSMFWKPSGVFGGSPTIGQFRGVNGENGGAHSITRLDFNLGGGGQAHNNLQPYVVVYIWKRTA